MTDTPKKPWYREFYVWMVIFFPLLAVVAGFYTLKLAIDSDDGLVEDDYYKQGIEINRILERDKRAAQRGLQANVNIDTEHKLLRVVINSSKPDYKRPDKIVLKLLYNTKAGTDHKLSLQHMTDDSYYAPLPDLKAGNWTLQLEAEDWRLLGIVKVPNTGTISLTPTV